jgi:hypothetical protein
MIISDVKPGGALREEKRREEKVDINKFIKERC